MDSSIYVSEIVRKTVGFLGFPLGLLCLVNVRDKDEPKKKMKLSMKAIKLISFYAVLLIFLAALCVNLFYQGYFTPDSNICKLL